MKEKLKAKLKEQSALVKAALDAERAMTDDEQTKYDALEKEIGALEKTIEVMAKQAEREAEETKPVNQPIHAQPRNPDEKKWKSYGEYLQAIVKAQSPNGSVDPRIVRNAPTGANEGITSEGGFLVDQQFVGELMDAMMSQSQVASRITMIPIGENSNGIRMYGVDESSRENGSRWGGVQAYWASEAGTVTATKPKFREIDFKLDKLMAICYATDELLRDASAMATVVRRAYADETSFKVDDAIINGTGAGMPLGVLNSGALHTVSKETGQAADTVVYENILKMWAAMPSRNRQNAVWYINQEIEPQLYSMVLSAGTSAVPVYLPSTGVSGGQYSTLMNRPVVPIEQCAKLGDKGDIVLMDPTEYVGIDKDNLLSESSIHVKFLYDESVFRFIYRFNGQPYRTSTITPFKANSGFKMSPFVTLAERA